MSSFRPAPLRNKCLREELPVNAEGVDRHHGEAGFGFGSPVDIANAAAAAATPAAGAAGDNAKPRLIEASARATLSAGQKAVSATSVQV